MKRIGLVVGKFSPLHKGHQFILDYATQQTERLVILSYSVPEFADCDSHQRLRWLKELYPEATCLVLSPLKVAELCDDFNIPLASNDAPDDVHRDFCAFVLDKFNLGPVTDLYTSEGYGQGFASKLTLYYQQNGQKNLRVKHHLVDEQRINAPISGTVIRDYRNTSKRWLNDLVFQDYKVQSCCLIGAESTGKSTLAKALAKEFDDPCCAEYGRELWEQNNGVLDEADLLTIAQKQIAREHDSRNRARNFLFCDTSALTTLLYFEHYFQYRHPRLEMLAQRPYRHLFLCCPDFPMVQDGTRQDEKFRSSQHEWYLRELEKNGMDYHLLEGSWTEKLKQITTIIRMNA